MPLSDTACKNAKPSTVAWKLADGRGLYLFIKPNGSKLWRMDYSFSGKRKTLSFGRYPEVKLSEARTLRDNAKEALKAGKDPNGIQERSETFESAARDWFSANRSRWVSSYSTRIWSRIESDILPEIGSLGLGEIEPPVVLKMLRKIEDRGALEMAKRMRQTVSQIYSYAIAEGRAKYDPAASLAPAMRKRPRQKHRAALKRDELPEFFTRLHNYGGDAQTPLAIEFIANTFVRTQELRFARWEEFEDDIWRIPAKRMKMRNEHIVPLSKQAKNMLSKLRELSGASQWVLPGAYGPKPISENTLIYAMYRLGYRSRATIHGFRSTASTILNESGLWRPDAIERQLAHVPRDEVRHAYNAALYLDERKHMMQWYSDMLELLDPDLSKLLTGT